jgi:hypothetical protein
MVGLLVYFSAPIYGAVDVVLVPFEIFCGKLNFL